MNRLNIKLVHDNNNRAKGDAPQLIQIYIRLNGKRKLISTNERVKKSQWNEARQQVIKHPEREEINEYLEDLIDRIKKYRREETRKGNTITVHCIERHLKNQNAEYTDFLEFCRDKVKTIKASDATRKAHTALFNKLESFQNQIPFSSINESFINAFVDHFKRSKNNKGEAIKASYIASRMTFLRKYLDIAKSKGFVKNVPSIEFDISVARKESETLTFSEVMKVYSYRDELRFEKQKMVIDAFVYCCLGGGLRYCDIIGNSKKEGDGLRVRNVKTSCFKMYHDVVHTKTKKYQTRSLVPIHSLFNGLPQKIIGQYLRGKTKDELVFGIYSNSIANKLLRKVVAKLNIDKYIQFKTSRHTFTTLATEAGIKEEVVQKMVGHKSIKTTGIYTHESIEYISSQIEGKF